jgi:flagellin-like hook-associated protein FlgL
MSIAINSNQAATRASLNMKRVSDRLGKSLNRLSSGMRITTPGEDAGGMAVGMKLQSTLRRAKASMQNTQNGISFLQMQDSVLKVAGDIVDRMAELKSFFNDVSKNDMDRETYNHEFHELQKELGTLKRQKFNGVSLFAQREPDNNPLKIITSDDGLGEHIELNRMGLFENMKSKYGADGVLNTGASGMFRQVVGDFTKDGGTLDAKPGYTSRNYSKGEVLFKNGGAPDDAGYFMALQDVKAGARIEDTASPTSQWIRISDSQGKGFAESYPDAAEYDPYSMKYNSKGDQVAYLKGDILKVPAHFASTGSYLYIKAEADVPRGMTLGDIFSRENDVLSNIGEGKYFSFVGEDSLDGAKPTTEYIRANINYPEPTSVVNTGGLMTAADLIELLKSNAANGYTPDHISSEVNGQKEILTPAFDWGLSEFNSKASYNWGDMVFKDDTDQILQMNQNVKGSWSAGRYADGDFVLYDGVWHSVNQLTGASATDRPTNPDTTDAFFDTNGYSSGDAVVADNKQVVVATSVMQGEFNPYADYSGGQVVHQGTVFYELSDDDATALSNDWTAGDPAANTLVRHNGQYYMRNATTTGFDSSVNPADAAVGWDALGSSLAAIAASGATGITLDDVTSDVDDEATSGASNTGAYFKLSPFQVYDIADGTTVISDPTLSLGGSTGDVTGSTPATDSYLNLNNTKYWTKTHYGSLDGITVNKSYQYGDNIFHQGKHYIYTSHLSSDHSTFLEGADPNSGYTEFDVLKRMGAVTELTMYVDTVAGGGNGNLPSGVYYRPNQSLDYVDRLPNSGDVRTGGAERRTDAPLPPGDEIFGSADDSMYGGLNAGNDGIYGTADDYYASTIDPNIARNGGQIDADADNNKNLLDTSNGLEDFSVADFVDYIQSVANFRAVNGGIMSRLNYATNILEENEVNLEAAVSRIMDVDMAKESARLAQQSVKLQASASMITQANQLNQVVLQLLQ